MPDLKEFLRLQSQYVFEPLRWAYDMVGFRPDTWQRQELEAAEDHPFSVLSTGSGVGKTAYLAIRILHFLCTRPFPKVPCTAPSQHQLNDVLWGEILKWMRRSELLSKMLVWTAEKVALKGHEGEWYAVARTSRPRPGDKTAEGLQGFHSDHLLFIVDEASGVPDQIMGAIDGAFTTPGACAILASNPVRSTGYFARALNQSDLWHIRFVNAEDSAFVTKSSIERIAHIYGRNSEYYRMRVLGLPPRSESNALITPEQVYDAHKRQVTGEGDKFASCDPARFGDDDSVLFWRQGFRVMERFALHGMDTAQVATLLVRVILENDIDEARVDEIGIGAGVVDAAKKLLGSRKDKIVGVHVGEAASNPDEFFNLRAELAWNLRTSINNVGIPFETELLDQELTTIKYGWDNKDKKIRLQSKDEVKRELKRSPNDFDSFALLNAKLSHKYINVNPKIFAIGARQESAPTNRLATPSSTPTPISASTLVVGAGRYSQFGTSMGTGTEQRYTDL